MPRLPVISGREAVDAFEKAGWTETRIEGSYIIMTKAGKPVSLSIPNHREVKRGTLRGLIRHAGLTVGEFSTLLKD
jgi:predicted RNA binding protein YcfA (HicA-like mRNA interferase family)